MSAIFLARWFLIASFVISFLLHQYSNPTNSEMAFENEFLAFKNELLHVCLYADVDITHNLQLCHASHVMLHKNIMNEEETGSMHILGNLDDPEIYHRTDKTFVYEFGKGGICTTASNEGLKYYSTSVEYE